MGQEWDFIAMGGGAAGNGGGRHAAELGFKVAVIEQDRLGGACQWTACVPSKALLQAAKSCWRYNTGPRSGSSGYGEQSDPANALDYVRDLTNRLGSRTTPESMAEKGVEVIRGTAGFEDENTLRVGGRLLRARRILIATGSRPRVPDIPGIDEVDYLTNLNLFDLPGPPKSMIIMGAGPAGIEMCQAFNRLDTEVTVLEQTDRILPRTDAELAEKLRNQLTDEGVNFILGADVRKVEQTNDSCCAVTLATGDGERVLEAEKLLIAVGREVAVEELGLDRAGVRGDTGGISVNDRLQTDNPNVYAAGDALGCWQFTHMATIESKHATRNALLDADEPMSYDAAGWCMFTDPELASIGLSEAEANERGLDFEVYRIDPAMPDRAQIEGRPDGGAKIIAEPRGGRIFGAQILAARAGEIIQEFSAAIRHGIPFRGLAEDVHPYPTLSIAHYVSGQVEWMQGD